MAAILCQPRCVNFGVKYCGRLHQCVVYHYLCQLCEVIDQHSGAQSEFYWLQGTSLSGTMVTKLSICSNQLGFLFVFFFFCLTEMADVFTIYAVRSRLSCICCLRYTYSVKQVFFFKFFVVANLPKCFSISICSTIQDTGVVMLCHNMTS